MKRFRPLTISILRLVTLVALPSIACLSYAQSITASDGRNSTFIRFTTFDVPNSVNINPTAISPSGQIVGYYQDATYTYHAFLRSSDGAITSFDVPGAGQGSSLGTVVTGINPKGQIVGEDIYVNNVLMSRGFVREADGTFTIFDALPDAIYTDAYAINPAGQIAGTYVDANYFSHGFARNSDGTITSFDVPGFIQSVVDINPAGQIAGSYLESDGTMLGFLRDSDGAITSFHAPGVSSQTEIGCGLCHGTLATAINREGRIVGYYGGTDAVHGFLRHTDGRISSFGVNTYPADINSEGLITGFLQDTNGVHGFLRKPDGAITTFDAPNSIDTNPTAISPSGQIVGYYEDAGQVVHGFVASRRRHDW